MFSKCLVMIFCSKARSLIPQHAETDVIRFLVGTQSLKFENQVIMCTYTCTQNMHNLHVGLEIKWYKT